MGVQSVVSRSSGWIEAHNLPSSSVTKMIKMNRELRAAHCVWLCQPLLEKGLIFILEKRDTKSLTLGRHMSCEGLFHNEKSKLYHFFHHASCRTCRHDLLCLAGARWSAADWEGEKRNHSSSPGLPLCLIGWQEREDSGRGGLGNEDSGTQVILQILWLYQQITNSILFGVFFIESQWRSYPLVASNQPIFNVPGQHQAFGHS